jgi:hypothetical protein
MLDCSCRFEGFAGLGDVSSSDFEQLNNAIVKASMRGGAWYALATDWQDRVVEERNWKIAIPPLWSALMEEFWTKYGQLYRAESNKTGITNPYNVAPHGISGALRDLFAPTIDTARNVQVAAEAKLQQLKESAQARVTAALKAAGRDVAEGAADKTKEETTNWLAWAAGIAVIGGLGYVALRNQRMGRSMFAF